jgi:hypothetical protein
MPIDTSKPNQKIQVLHGQTLFDEATSCNSLNLLHEGSYSIIKKFGNTNISLIEMAGKNLTPGVLSLFSNERYHYSLKSTNDSIVSTYQITKATIKKNIMSKMSLGIMIARTLLKENLELTKRANQIQSFLSLLEHTIDNLSLSYYILDPSMFSGVEPGKYTYNEDEDHTKDPILKITKKNLSTFWESGGQLPTKPTLSFLNDKLEDQLKKKYSETIDFDDSEFLFMRKILSIDSNLQTPIYEADITILLQICEKFSSSFLKVLDLIEENMESLLNSIKLFAGEDGLLDKYYLLLEMLESGMSDDKPEVVLPIAEFLNEKLTSIQKIYKSLFHSEIPNISKNVNLYPEKFNSVQKHHLDFTESMSPSESSSQSFNDTSSNTEVGVNIEAIRKELIGSPSKIMTFVNFPQEQVKEFNALLAKFKSMKNPLDPDSEARKIRKNITKLYWDVYSIASLKNIESNGNVPKLIKLMLQFGYFDDTLLENEHIHQIYNFKDSINSNSDVNIYTCDEWLERIYNKKSVTSLDELGQTYFDKIKNDNKEEIFKKESEVPDSLNTNPYRMNYELNAMYMPNVRLTTGNPASYMPILNKYQINLPLEKCIVRKTNIIQSIKEIMNIDYTAFNREIMFNDDNLGIRKEFVQKSVIPDFIIVPSIGTKIMMWQDLSILRGAGSKESKGRIVLPMIVLGDLKTLLLEAIAAFRWELCKNILGPEWNNVGIPSITSEYMDYIQFYKKNKDLSIELKEKISSEFKRFRTDRDKFVNDYMLWIKYESEGVQRLNKVVRGIFYKHIPFEKTIRDKVSKLPAFSDLHNRFTNIRSRQYKEYETKYRKYVDGTGKLHPQLQENLDFYKV